jgi:hypothetical protein
MTVTNRALDPDPDAQQVTFALEPGSPAGVSLDPLTGVLAWTPSEAEGPGTYIIGIRATDNGTPPLSTTASVSVFVTELNTPPALALIPARTVAAGSTVELDCQASDSDLPLQLLGYALVPPAPAGATVDPASGHFAWTTASGDSGTNRITIRVTDDGVPPLSASRTFDIIVEAGFALTVTWTEASLSIQFPSVAGQSYRLEWTGSLGGGGWTGVGGEITAVGTSTSFELPLPSEPQSFYRVVRTH